MRRSALWIAAALVAAPLCSSAVAQQQIPPAQTDPYAQGAPAAQPRQGEPGAMGMPHHGMQHPGMPPGQVLVGADSIIGSKVRDPNGEELGQVQGLMLRPEDGRIQYAVLTLGGVLGVGGQQVAVPWQSLKVTRDAQKVVITAERQVLTQAPRYDADADGRVDADEKAKEND